jgi:hypothetical protein
MRPALHAVVGSCLQLMLRSSCLRQKLSKDHLGDHSRSVAPLVYLPTTFLLPVLPGLLSFLQTFSKICPVVHSIVIHGPSLLVVLELARPETLNFDEVVQAVYSFDGQVVVEVHCALLQSLGQKHQLDLAGSMHPDSASLATVALEWLHYTSEAGPAHARSGSSSGVEVIVGEDLVSKRWRAQASQRQV